MLVGMTIGAPCAGHTDAEVRRLVARLALDPRVPPKQRIPCPAVIEIRRNRSVGRVPASRVVALCACCLESPTMRIAVTVRTLGKWQPFELDRGGALVGGMTAVARDRCVQAG